MSTTLLDNIQSWVVWRDSVAAGDDIDAPHEIELRREECDSVADVVAQVISAGCLPKISGGRATWVAEADSRPLAVIAQQWSAPRYVVHANLAMAPFIGKAAGCHIYVKYWCQADPDTVLECLKSGNPLPSKHS